MKQRPKEKLRESLAASYYAYVGGPFRKGQGLTYEENSMLHGIANAAAAPPRREQSRKVLEALERSIKEALIYFDRFT